MVVVVTEAVEVAAAFVEKVYDPERAEETRLARAIF